LNLTAQTELIRLRKENEPLRMERETLKKAAVFPTASSGQALRKKSSKVRFSREQQKTYPVTVLCLVMQVSTSAFYTWTQATENTTKRRKETALGAKTRELFEANKKSYGSRRSL
jgi:hypothetical protein